MMYIRMSKISGQAALHLIEIDQNYEVHLYYNDALLEKWAKSKKAQAYAEFMFLSQNLDKYNSPTSLMVVSQLLNAIDKSLHGNKPLRFYDEERELLLKLDPRLISPITISDRYVDISLVKDNDGI